MGHPGYNINADLAASQVAKAIGARGPATHINGACSSTTQALIVADEWIKSGKVNTELPKLMPTSSLVGSTDSAHKAELQWRLSAPLSLFALTLIAVPLSRSSPRQGRYGRLALGILVYVLYSNLTEATHSWVEREMFPSVIGIYWVPLVIVTVAVLMLWWQERNRRGPRRAAGG
jgi:lipopolysaccharide export LptBFGC system permease protein LptF